ncbi:SHOCT domain-containing protein [Streptomyces virginiae]|uniref:SHOCT domain-containing protein n=1 Tax=Streptomyces virginiae TaxID=1961 RepID=UPI000526FE57|nr:SHOCT domain-containing protein [Streptomyces virginiae]MCX4717948.1 SHOCT domain-containing protein [Streptomyces virginiae]MCX5277874.1 SHOCT domain-containing protein [Streptomyces virginiae]
MFWYDHGMGGWGWIAMSFSMVLLVALAVAAVVLFLRSVDRYPSGPAQPLPAPSAKQLLAERFARGEIDEEEYEQRLTALRAHGPGQGRPGPGDN